MSNENAAGSSRPRAASWVLRPTSPPLWLGIAVAAGLIALETLLVLTLERFTDENAYGALFLLGVLVISANWGFGLAVATTVVSAAVYTYFHMGPDGFNPAKKEDWIAIVIFVPLALLANVLVGQARLRAAEADQRRREAEASKEELRVVAEQLAASRARIVTAADDARRRLERDLHDGAQQRLLALGLELRTAESSLRSEANPVADDISDVVSGLTSVSEELREISRGIHPAILSKGGLGPALKALARRSAVPVELGLALDGRLPESVEAAAYYVVAESLTNVAKYARASAVTVTAESDAANLSLRVHDDGIGGADPTMGSGLIGLTDRVEALGGRLTMSSPPNSGTSLSVTIPFELPGPAD